MSYVSVQIKEAFYPYHKVTFNTSGESKIVVTVYEDNKKLLDCPDIFFDVSIYLNLLLLLFYVPLENFH